MKYVTFDSDNECWCIFDSEVGEVYDQYASKDEAEFALINLNNEKPKA